MGQLVLWRDLLPSDCGVHILKTPHTHTKPQAATLPARNIATTQGDEDGLCNLPAVSPGNLLLGSTQRRKSLWQAHQAGAISRGLRAGALITRKWASPAWSTGQVEGLWRRRRKHAFPGGAVRCQGLGRVNYELPRLWSYEGLTDSPGIYI